MASALSRFITQLATEDWLSPAIDALNASSEPERWGPPRVEIHPSGSGSPCAREIELSMLGYRSGVKALNRRRMDNGTAAHERWNGYFAAAGLLHKANVRTVLAEPFPWSGECDVICENPVTHRLHVGELKTMNSRKWRDLPAQLVDRRAMARLLLEHCRGYVYQLTQYIVKLGPLYGTEREGFFLFENTDTQEFKVLYVEPDDALRVEAFKLPREAQSAALEGRLIDPPFRRKSPTCRKCYRESLCYLLQDGDAELWQRVQTALTSASGQSVEPSVTPTPGSGG